MKEGTVGAPAMRPEFHYSASSLWPQASRWPLRAAVLLFIKQDIKKMLSMDPSLSDSRGMGRGGQRQGAA